MRKIFCLIFLLAASLYSLEESEGYSASDTEDPITDEDDVDEDDVENKLDLLRTYFINIDDCRIFSTELQLCAWQALLQDNFDLLNKLLAKVPASQQESESFRKIQQYTKKQHK